MSEERRRILAMLADGKITADEAEELLDAIETNKEKDSSTVSSNVENESDETNSKKKKPKYLRIMVEPKDGHSGEKVNIRIPMMLLKAGVKLASVVPGGAKDKIGDKLKDKGINIDLDNLDSKSLDEIVTGLGSMCIDVDDDKEKVKIFCE